jgi:hypothetical protein|tara:strand:- start:53 stop:262 length:210 start_codon:yes stop_codon:yes gene_type:complete
MRYIVTMHPYNDPEEFPRAWANAPTLEAARREAHHQLNVYRGKKAQTFDPLALQEYAEVVETYEEGERT